MALKYKITLPAPGANDVVSRKLSTSINGGEATVTELPGDALETEALYADDDNVSLTLVDVDDAGNESAPSPTLEFVAKDTIAPNAPGELGATLIEEI